MSTYGANAFASTPFAAEITVPPPIDLDLADAGAGVDGALDTFLGVVLSSGLSVAATTREALFTQLADALAVSSDSTPDVLANLVDRLLSGAVVQMSAVLQGTASDSVSFLDSVVSAWQLLLAESLATSDEAVGSVHKLAALVDALTATGQASNNLIAFAACVEAIAMEDLIAQGFNVDAIDAALLADTCASVAKLLGPLVDSLLASDDATPSLRLSMIAADSVTVASAGEALLRANGDLADGLLLYATLRIGGTDYVGWALNTDIKAASQYTNTPFDSFASFKGRHYAAGTGGLVEFSGAKDSGADIDWSIKTFLMDFGTSKFKRLPDAFIGATSTGQLVLKVITRLPQTGVQEEDWYLVERLPVQGPGQGHVQIGRGLKSTWWQFELTSVNGADFALDDIAFRPLSLDRRT